MIINIISINKSEFLSYIIVAFFISDENTRIIITTLSN